jgi:hypothetical protein
MIGDVQVLGGEGYVGVRTGGDILLIQSQPVVKFLARLVTDRDDDLFSCALYLFLLGGKLDRGYRRGEVSGEMKRFERRILNERTLGKRDEFDAALAESVTNIFNPRAWLDRDRGFG